MRRAAFLLLLAPLAACARGDDATSGAATEAGAMLVPVTVAGAGGSHVFRSEIAKTAAQQEKGLMFRTGLADDYGMLFAPYPAEGGPPREANFWMKDTPSPLDIIYIRADGTIARIAENAVPFDRSLIPSGEPVAAVLEVRGGRAAELGIAEGDRVRWPALAK